MGIPDQLMGAIAEQLIKGAINAATEPEEEDDEETKELKRQAREGSREAIAILNQMGIFEYD